MFIQQILNKFFLFLFLKIIHPTERNTSIYIFVDWLEFTFAYNYYVLLYIHRYISYDHVVNQVRKYEYKLLLFYGGLCVQFLCYTKTTTYTACHVAINIPHDP